jgi:hypothetical protein
MKLVVALAFLVCAPLLAATAGEGPENFRFELTGSAWLFNSSGTIQANGSPIDLVTDLGAEQQQPTFYGRFVFKPGRHHRIVVEGSPISISGLNTVQRTVVYRGQSFNVNEILNSSADLNCFFAGYQYDLLTGRIGHLGFSAGGAYLGARGTITAVQASTTATKSETIGLPLAGMDFRVFPIPGHKIIEVEGGLRGMGVGSYGHFIEGSASGGVRLGPIGILAGYRELLADFHETGNGGSGVNLRLRGPIFSALWSW